MFSRDAALQFDELLSGKSSLRSLYWNPRLTNPFRVLRLIGTRATDGSTGLAVSFLRVPFTSTTFTLRQCQFFEAVPNAIAFLIP
jgi:hypothetical protein